MKCSIHRATQDVIIGACQLNILGRIGEAPGVKTKRLYEEEWEHIPE